MIVLESVRRIHDAYLEQAGSRNWDRLERAVSELDFSDAENRTKVLHFEGKGYKITVSESWGTLMTEDTVITASNEPKLMKRDVFNRIAEDYLIRTKGRGKTDVEVEAIRQVAITLTNKYMGNMPWYVESPARSKDSVSKEVDAQTINPQILERWKIRRADVGPETPRYENSTDTSTGK